MLQKGYLLAYEMASTQLHMLLATAAQLQLDLQDKFDDSFTLSKEASEGFTFLGLMASAIAIPAQQLSGTRGGRGGRGRGGGRGGYYPQRAY